MNKLNAKIAGKLNTNAYADDTLIYCQGSTVEESVKDAESLLCKVHDWYRQNLHQLNTSKSNTAYSPTEKIFTISNNAH